MKMMIIGSINQKKNWKMIMIQEKLKEEIKVNLVFHWRIKSILINHIRNQHQLGSFQDSFLKLLIIFQRLFHYLVALMVIQNLYLVSKSKCDSSIFLNSKIIMECIISSYLFSLWLACFIKRSIIIIFI